MNMLTSLFCCSFLLFHNKNMFERMWRGDYKLYSAAMGDVLLERELVQLLYGQKWPNLEQIAI